jgi:putative sigma-54 modulation protein
LDNLPKRGVKFVQIKLSVRHGQLSEEKQNHIRAKAEKLLHYFERLTMIEILVDLKKEEPHVECLVQAEHKHDFVASERNLEVLTAVDAVLGKVEAQIRKYKEKIQDHRRTPSTGEVGEIAKEERDGDSSLESQAVGE